MPGHTTSHAHWLLATTEVQFAGSGASYPGGCVEMGSAENGSSCGFVSMETLE